LEVETFQKRYRLNITKNEDSQEVDSISESSTVWTLRVYTVFNRISHHTGTLRTRHRYLALN
jgi:hypothetical protein